VHDGRKMGGGSQVKQVLVSTLQGALQQGHLVAVKVDTASDPGSHQKEVGHLEVEHSVYQQLKMDSCPIEIPDSKDQRFSVLSYEQVSRLSELMNEVVPIHGRGNFPTLEVKLCDLVSLVKTKLEQDGVIVREIRLNGSGASSVLASECCDISYNDLDLIFTVDLPTQKHYERVKQAVLDSLLDLLPEQTSKKRMSSCTLKEAYVSKMVKVNDSDRWSLIALGNNKTNSVELKFVDRMKRKFEFSVDSFHIMLDTLFLFYDCARMDISENFYPTVVGESVYGNFGQALYHLHRKLIATRNPEEIRGGGLLKYCNLLVKNYRPAWPEAVKTMERYMCSRFFIDFPDLTQQHNKLFKFLDNHFHGADSQLKYDYLMILYQVVDESTVCLMGHERRQTLALIQDLSCQVGTPGNPYYDPPEISSSSSSSSSSSASSTSSSSFASPGSAAASTGNWSSASSTSGQSSSWSSASSSSSQTGAWGGKGSSSSGQYSPMSTSSTCSPSLSPKPVECNTAPPQQQADHQVPPPSIVPHKFSVPPPSHPPPPATHAPPPTHTAPPPSHQVAHTAPPPPLSAPPMTAPPPSLAVQCPPPPSQPPPPCMAPVQPASVPTYEIVTSCQPSVMYSNGYYYTSFVPPPPPQAPASSTPASTPTSAPLQYSSVVSGQQVMAPQYSAVAAGGAPVQYTPAANSGSPVQYSSSSGAPPVQYTAASTVQFTPGTSVHYTTSPLPQQQYSTHQGGQAQQFSQMATPCYSCSCSCGAPAAPLGQAQWVTTVAPQPTS